MISSADNVCSPDCMTSGGTDALQQHKQVDNVHVILYIIHIRYTMCESITLISIGQVRKSWWSILQVVPSNASRTGARPIIRNTCLHVTISRTNYTYFHEYYDYHHRYVQRAHTIWKELVSSHSFIRQKHMVGNKIVSPNIAAQGTKILCSTRTQNKR